MQYTSNSEDKKEKLPHKSFYFEYLNLYFQQQLKSCNAFTHGKGQKGQQIRQTP